jgi:hypothetical protein
MVEALVAGVGAVVLGIGAEARGNPVLPSEEMSAIGNMEGDLAPEDFDAAG